jgi:aspartyl protease family protein
MARLYFIVIAIGLLVGLFAPSTRKVATDDGAGHLTGTFGESSDKPAERVDRRITKTRAAQSITYSDGNAVVLQREENGHFFVDAQVNGMSVHFLVDTGASGVALTTADAQRVGLPFSRAEFGAVGQGASGPVNGKFVTLDRVSMKGKTVQNVSGVILEGGEMSLLGQSFLSRMGKIEISGDRMVIR